MPILKLCHIRNTIYLVAYCNKLIEIRDLAAKKKKKNYIENRSVSMTSASVSIDKKDEVKDQGLISSFLIP